MAQLTTNESSNEVFPRIAFFQPGGFLQDVQQEMKSRGIEIVILKTQPSDGHEAVRREMESLHNLDKKCLVAGLPWYVETAFDVLKIPVPNPPDYPNCLRHLLGRNVWTSTLGQVEHDLKSGNFPTIFVKPAKGAKGFNGTVLKGPVDGMLSGKYGWLNPEIFPNIKKSGGRHFPVYCSNVIEMNSEYAVYVVEGEIRSVCHYMCKASTCRCKAADLARTGVRKPIEMDMSVVHDAVRLLSMDEGDFKHVSGYRADFALVRSMVNKSEEGREEEEIWRTCLIEVNDGYVAGRYDGMKIKDYADMMISRFSKLQETSKR